MAACGRGDPAPGPTAPPVAPSRDAATPIDAPAASVIPPATRELVTAIVADWGATRARLRRYRRAGARWEPVGDAWDGVVGASGTAWGVGLHGDGAPAGRAGPIKREGDGKSPAGAFALRGAYGYAARAPDGTRLAYSHVDERWRCVDDPASRRYGQIFDARGIAADWRSAETMQLGEAYRWVVDVAHNPARTPARGSCIFLHVWSGADTATVGCTAMPAAALAALIADLDPTAVYVLLPRAEYAALAPAWGLP